MDFEHQFPEWDNEGIEPSEEIKKKGFEGGYKPPASLFNWFWSKVMKGVKELQTKLSGEEKAVHDTIKRMKGYSTEWDMDVAHGLARRANKSDKVDEENLAYHMAKNKITINKGVEDDNDNQWMHGATSKPMPYKIAARNGAGAIESRVTQNLENLSIDAATGKVDTVMRANPLGKPKAVSGAEGDRIPNGMTSEEGGWGMNAANLATVLRHRHYQTLDHPDGCVTQEKLSADLGERLIGNNTTASGEYAHAEGNGTTASGEASHAEGQNNLASGGSSHAEGDNTIASGGSSHAEGHAGVAEGLCSHVEGRDGSASGDYSHAEGYITYSNGTASHTEGKENIAGSAIFEVIISGADVTLKNKAQAALMQQYIADATTYFFYSSYGLDSNEDVNIERQSIKVTAVDSATGKLTVNQTLTQADAESNNIIVAHAKNISPSAKNDGVHAEGVYTIACGEGAHAEGRYNIVNALGAHAEGQYNLANGESAHAEGNSNTASGDYSHAEGDFNIASAPCSHAEGNNTIASGNKSHAEGSDTIARGAASHTEGYTTLTHSAYSHTEGMQNAAGCAIFDVEVKKTTAPATVKLKNLSQKTLLKSYISTSGSEFFYVYGSATDIWADNRAEYDVPITTIQVTGFNETTGEITIAGEIKDTQVQAICAHHNTIDPQEYNSAVHVEGSYNLANGESAHAEGLGNRARGFGAHAEGVGTYANGSMTHAEGWQTIASDDTSHAEGYQTKAVGPCCHAEGEITQAIGEADHAEGWETTAEGSASHAEGYQTLASDSYSHAEGGYTRACTSASHTEGMYNIAGSGIFQINVTSSAITLNDKAQASLMQQYISKGNATFYYSSCNTVDVFGYGGSYSEIGEYGEIQVTAVNATTGQLTIKGTIRPNSENVFVIYAYHESISPEKNEDGVHVEGKYSAANGEAAHAEGLGTIARQFGAHAEGGYTRAIGPFTHAEGNCTLATHDCSHAEGRYTQAIAEEAHAEGWRSIASGEQAHAEGIDTIAGRDSSHAEGKTTYAYAENAHAEGMYTIAGSGIFEVNVATGSVSLKDKSQASLMQQYIAKGSNTEFYYSSRDTDWIYGNSGQGTVGLESIRVTAVNTTTGQLTINKTIAPNSNNSFVVYAYHPDISPEENTEAIHVEGAYSSAQGQASHAEGFATIAKRRGAHAEGGGTSATGALSHAEGYRTIATDDACHAEGWITQSIGVCTHAEGEMTIARNEADHAEGCETEASGSFSHAEGYRTKAEGGESHSEGFSTIASGSYSHAEGDGTEASGNFAPHSEGSGTIASGETSHAEGAYTTASGVVSHSQGENTTASGNHAHSEGFYTTAASYLEHVQGRYNKLSTTSATAYNSAANAMVIGNGTSSTARSNAFRVTFNGNVYGLATFHTTGADYAEYFEWADGNPDGEERVGRFVAIDGEKIRIAEKGDTNILGIVSVNPAVLGNAHEDTYHGMYQTDEWGRVQYEYVDVPAEYRERVTGKDEDGNNIIERVEVRPAHKDYVPKLNPDYNPEKEYIPRSERNEWDAVGMMGQLLVHDDGTCVPGRYCTWTDGGAATASETGYYVMSRVSDGIVKVIFK